MPANPLWLNIHNQQELPVVPVDFAEYDAKPIYFDWADDLCPACGRAVDRHSSTQLTHCGQFSRIIEETT